MKKTILMLVMVLMVVLSFPAYALAEDTSRSYHFGLSSNGADTVTAAPNQVVTVTFTLDRTDAQDRYTMFAMQDEIQYDPAFFELVEGSVMLDSGVESTDLGMRDGARRLYMNFVSLSGGADWAPRVTIGSFQLKVIAESGVGIVSNQDYLVSTSDGADAYTADASDLTVIVSTDCIVHFESNGGTEVPDQPVLYGEKVTEPNDPVREGYFFAGWYSDIDLTEKWDFDEDTVAQTMTLYARWSTVEVIEDAGVALGGFELPWWSWLIAGLVLIPLILLLLWFLLKRTVEFEPNGGSPVESLRARWGTRIVEPEAPSKGGTLFEGWFKDEATKFAWDFKNDRVKKNMTLYAKWSSTEEK